MVNIYLANTRMLTHGVVFYQDLRRTEQGERNDKIVIGNLLDKKIAIGKSLHLFCLKVSIKVISK